MPNTLVITVAGISSRFRESLGYDVLKCLYSADSYSSILERLIYCGIYNKFNRIIIVGGYRYDELQNFIDKIDYKGVNISLIFNEKFDTWGSNYSLFLGLVEALKDTNTEKIVFVEGDLVFDYDSFTNICMSTKDVITINKNTINADTSVVFYLDLNKEVKYCYDPKHKYLLIKEPFLSILNSGQVWLFCDIERLRNVIYNQKEQDLNDTNLNIIQKYFEKKQISEINLMHFTNWFNCNTVEDYYLACKNINI